MSLITVLAIRLKEHCQAHRRDTFDNLRVKLLCDQTGDRDETRQKDAS
jgi:hypothetical protein